MKHELKISPRFFDAVYNNIKTFEVRKNDRDFHVGDTLYLKEYTGETGPYAGAPYTGRTTEKVVVYILEDEEYCPHGYVILGIAP